MDVKDLLYMTMLARATLVLAEHRPETVFRSAALMRYHEAVFLEEPPDSRFQQMLRGDLPVAERVKRFARVDSRRFLVRDRMRGEALAPMIRRFNKSYIEAGQFHVLSQTAMDNMGGMK